MLHAEKSAFLHQIIRFANACLDGILLVSSYQVVTPWLFCHSVILV
jgi:hypothetical protein